MPSGSDARWNGHPVVYETLDRLGVRYEAVAHQPAFTVEDMERIAFPPDVTIAKNLFLRDHRGKRHFLVVLRKDKAADLARLGEHLGTRLSFASGERLARFLNLTPGAVSPFGILHDESRAVAVLVDSDLRGCARLGVHPNNNAVTILIAPDDLFRVVTEHGNSLEFFDA